MAESLNSRFLDDPEFQSLLVGCLESLQRGETIDHNALAKDFPKFAEEIGRFLDDRQLLEEATSDFDDVPPSRVAISAYANTMDSNSGPSDFTIGETIRYIGEYEILEEIARWHGRCFQGSSTEAQSYCCLENDSCWATRRCI